MATATTVWTAAPPLVSPVAAASAFSPAVLPVAVAAPMSTVAVAFPAALVAGWSGVLPGLCILLLGSLTPGSGSILASSFRAAEPGISIS